MMNINEYFNNLYNNATIEEFDSIVEEELHVYHELEEEEFEQWAKDHNIDLTVMRDDGISEVQYWAWNFED